MTNENQGTGREGAYTSTQVLQMYDIARRLVQSAKHLEHLEVCVDSIRRKYEPRVKELTREALEEYSHLPQEIREGIAKIERLNVTELGEFLK